jgi:DNA-binding transcriptional LysR family regulator
MVMTLHQLRIFEAVSRHLNITKASLDLHISQPSVFQQVKTLEEFLGVKLYWKVSRGIELTEGGRLFQGEAREILSRVDRIQKTFGVVPAETRKGSLKTGGSHAPSVSLLPSLLAEYKKTHPLVQVTLRTKSSPGIERMIVRSEIEIGVVTNPSHSPLFHLVPYRQQKLVVIAPAGHPLSKRKELSLTEIAEGPLIVRRGTGPKTLAILTQMVEQGLKPNILMECDSAEAVKVATIGGAGLGILYPEHVEAELARGEIKILNVSGLANIDLRSFIIYGKDKPLSQNARDFLELLQRSRSTTQNLRQNASITTTQNRPSRRVKSQKPQLF